MNATPSAACLQLERDLSDYLAGRLSATDAVGLEAHAATCARCEAVLEVATRRGVDFAPPLPPDVRVSTLRAIGAKAPVRRRARIGWSVLAAAAVLVVFVSRRPPRAPSSEVDTPTSGVASSLSAVASASAQSETLPRATPLGGPMAGVMSSASKLAELEAQPEFDELDAAARELEAALENAPTDRELREFLRTVRARRDELTRRVREATS